MPRHTWQSLLHSLYRSVSKQFIIACLNILTEYFLPVYQERRIANTSSSLGSASGQGQSSSARHQLGYQHCHLLIQGEKSFTASESYQDNLRLWAEMSIDQTFQDFKFRAILLSTFKRKKPSSRSFRTSIRSSFGSTRYRHHQSQSLSSRVYNNTEPARTAETSIRESTDTEAELRPEKGAEGKRLIICDNNLGVVVNDRIRNHNDSV